MSTKLEVRCHYFNNKSGVQTNGIIWHLHNNIITYTIIIQPTIYYTYTCIITSYVTIIIYNSSIIVYTSRVTTIKLIAKLIYSNYVKSLKYTFKFTNIIHHKRYV